MTDKEKRLFDLQVQYDRAFGDGARYPLEQAPPLNDDELLALYERCLREGKPWENFVNWEDIPDVLY